MGKKVRGRHMDQIPHDPIRKLIKDRAAEVRLTLADISRGIGRNPTYIHQYMRRGSPAVLPEDMRNRVAELLGLPESALRPSPEGRLGGTPQLLLPSPFPILRPLPRDSTREAIPSRDVPIFADTDPVDVAQATEWAHRPAALLTSGGSFALWISGNRGRLRPGDLAFVRTTQPPRIGDCIVALKGKEIAAIGDLIAVDDDCATVWVAADIKVDLDRAGHRLLKVASITTA
jgi:hypothetical protein